MDNYHCGGGYYFSSNFDSGNLAKIELVNLVEGNYKWYIWLSLNKYVIEYVTCMHYVYIET